MTDLVDQMFPPINKKWAPEYTDLTYWKIPVPEYPLPDLTPPSPTLSAQSETLNQSTLAKIRNFRLIGGSRPNSISSPNELFDGLNSSQDGNNTGLSNDPDGEAESRQMSSFERLVSGLRGSVSPSPTLSHTAESDSESDVDAPQGGRRLRRRSMASMPGSLDGMHFGIDDEHSDEHSDENEDERDKESGEEYEDEEGEIDEDLTMDEDLLAATEMKKIPFL
jgi:phosphatidate phosphatase LPIN